jgi:hypothetical protein
VDIADDEAMRNIVLAHAAVQAQIVVVLRRDGVCPRQTVHVVDQLAESVIRSLDQEAALPAVFDIRLQREW